MVITSVRNWAGNYTYRAARMHYPATIDDLRAIVARTTKLHALGTRHCFNDIADGAELVSLERIAPEVAIDATARTVTASAGIKYGELAQILERAGWALHNMASLPHISLVGAVATATHGSGDANGNLATAVAGLEQVTSDGDLITVSRGDDHFAGMVVGLGALGVVTRLTLDIQPSYTMRQEVFEHLPWEVLFAHFDEVTSSADSVSLFTNYGETIDEVWLKTPGRSRTPGAATGRPAGSARRHPQPAPGAIACCRQLHRAARRARRLARPAAALPARCGAGQRRRNPGRVHGRPRRRPGGDTGPP